MQGQPGLSPRTRGKRIGWLLAASGLGPIPANTGETLAGVEVIGFVRAYPREHGGNKRREWAERRAEGLSPRTRGKPGKLWSAMNEEGPIPANTGETFCRA